MKPQSMTQKILARRAGLPYVEPGQTVEADVDMAFTHDPVIEVLRQNFYAEFGQDAKVWDRDRVALFEDHLVPAKDAACRRLALVMNSFAAEQGIQHHYPYGRDYGVCHIVMCEKGLALPGEIIVGTDSHSVTYGAFNAFGTGVGMIDMVCTFRTGKLWFRVPGVIQVNIEGRLPENVQAKDIILRLIGDIGMDGALGSCIEWTGSTIDAMSVEERMTLCNMVVEAGATNGIMAISEATSAYLSGVAKRAFEPVTTDPGYVYDRTIDYRAEDFTPMIAFPHSPANVHAITEVRDKKVAVNQVYVGSCTGAKFEDIRTVAEVLDGGAIAPGLHLVVVPASMDIYRKIADEGHLAVLLAAGAVVESPGCKACFGAHGGVLGDGEVCLSTTNRNFRGRMGNPETFVYLASPYIAGKTALSGYITD